MKLWKRLRNLANRERLREEMEEEIRLHLDEAVEAGRDGREARRAFGNRLAMAEASGDFRFGTRLESLVADAGFGARQLRKHGWITMAAVLSLGLAIGSTHAAFRLIDAVLLRPLPVEGADRLHVLVHERWNPDPGRNRTYDSVSYPEFLAYRTAATGRAQLLAFSYAGLQDITYGGPDAMEKARRQHVSGNAFATLGLQPALGRLLTEADDLRPGAHPVAVISYDYWTRRFGRDPKAVGRTFTYRGDRYEIVGVMEPKFTGPETGKFTDFYIPMMMEAKAVVSPNWSWFSSWVLLNPGVQPQEVRDRLAAASVRFREQKYAQEKNGWDDNSRRHIEEPVQLHGASAGYSGIQENMRRPLMILGVLVVLVLLIACANVANLLTAQSAARDREMALRMSIGAGRGRLVQLVLVESVLLAAAATVAGFLLSLASDPVLIAIVSSPGSRVQVNLPLDWRALLMTAALGCGVTLMFGLLPALRVSSVKPSLALKGGGDRRSRRYLMNGVLAFQVAFCFAIHFAAGLFVATVDRISRQPLGFEAAGVVTVDLASLSRQPVSVAAWDRVTSELRQLPGVESAAHAVWPLLSGSAWTSAIRVNGQKREAHFLGVSPGWRETMKITLLAGRDLRAADMMPDAAQLNNGILPGGRGGVLVNEAFARAYFGGEVPVGRTFEILEDKDQHSVATIVGYVRDARYSDLREEFRPVVYSPFGPQDWASLVVRSRDANYSSLAAAIRQRVAAVNPDLFVTNIDTQQALIDGHMSRERVISQLAVFFGGVALLLAAVGLYGVLSFGIQQRQREIGIRMALGAQPLDVARRVGQEVFAIIAAGSGLGLAAGIYAERFVRPLLFQVESTEISIISVPFATLFAAAILASCPPLARAIQIDPAVTLRAE